MNVDLKNSGPVVLARTPSVVPCGEFQGMLISALKTDDLRGLQGFFFRRDPATQRAIALELDRRHGRRDHRSGIRQRGKG